MSTIILDQFKNLQSKTTLKAIYLFFSFSLLFFIFTTIGLISLEVPSNLDDIFSKYFILIIITFLNATFLFYINIESVLFKYWINFLNKEEYPDYKDAQFKENFNYIFILKERDQFLSKFLFSLSLFFLYFIFWNIEALLFFLIIIFLLLGIKFLLKQFIKKEIKFLLPVLLILILIGCTTYNVIKNTDFVLLLLNLFFLIPIMILNTSLLFDWKKLEVKVKLIYFLELFTQYHYSDFNEDKNQIITDFIKKIENNRWKDAIYCFKAILGERFSHVINNEIEYKENLKTMELIIKFINKFEVDLRFNDFISEFNKINKILPIYLDKGNEKISYLSTNIFVQIILSINSFDEILIYLSEESNLRLYNILSEVYYNRIYENRNKLQKIKNFFSEIRDKANIDLKTKLDAKKENKEDTISKVLNNSIFEIKKDQLINEFFLFLFNGVNVNIFSLKDYEFFINRIREKLDFLKKDINLNFKWNILKEIKARIFKKIQ